MPMLYRSSRSTNRKKGVSRKDQSAARLEKFRKEIITDAHAIPLTELCLRLETDVVLGLKEEQAERILRETGPNTLTPPTTTPEIIKFIRTLTHGFSALLWIGAGLCFGACLITYFSYDEYDTDNFVLGLSLIIVVSVTGVFMYIQERKSHKIMESFQNMVPAKACVVRDGEQMNINSNGVVVGDLVVIKFGDKIPADIRIIFSQSFKVDNSALTGETEPQFRSKDYTNENILETKNVAFFSTGAIEGTARGIVIATGDNTVMGHIAGLTARLKPNKTPLAKELHRFMKIISTWAVILGVFFGTLAILTGYDLLKATLFVIGIIVANVPEGLLPTVTVCLTVTAKKMANKNCLMKNLEAVETLGSSSVICSDKTGTLTQNRMSVCHIWIQGITYESDLSLNQNKAFYINDSSFQDLVRCAILCSRAEFLPFQENIPILGRRVSGDASEEAILKFVEITKTKGPIADYRKSHPKLIEIPFSSATKFQLSIHSRGNTSCLLVMKGAPEAILERCNKILYQNSTQQLSDEYRRICNVACQKLAAMGERVLGFCDLELEERFNPSFKFTAEPPNFPLRGLRFLGFLSLIDPPRAEVPEAIRTCHKAGIKVIMVTGDHPVTAKAISEQVGIITAKNVLEADTIDVIRRPRRSEDVAIVVHGNALRNMSALELDNIIENFQEIVFARTSPTQKLQIVEACQRVGEIVAVTGDGVNDAPALKKADIGIAMGITGTEVSQQSADVILLDDNFASIITAIEEGRRIFDNLKKSITYTLSSNVPEILPFLAHVIFKIPLPLGVIAVLCVDLLTDMLPAISLAYEKSESDIMNRPPRNPRRDKLVTRKLYFLAYAHLGVLEAFAGFSCYFIIMAEFGFYPESLFGIQDAWNDKGVLDLQDDYGQEWTYEERKILEGTCNTAFLMAIIITQVTNLIACKTRRNSISSQGMGNWVLNASIFIELIFGVLLSYAPGMHYLRFFPLRFEWWIIGVPFALIILGFDEFRKWHIRKYKRGYFQRETFY